jgi:hypothetical protein
LSSAADARKVHGHGSQSAKQAEDHRVEHRRSHVALDSFDERRTTKICAQDQDRVGSRLTDLSRHIQYLIVCRLGEAEIIGEV